MQHLQLDGTDLIATDNRRCIVLPVTKDEGDTDGFITTDALLAACKAKHPQGKGYDAVLLANTELRAPFGSHVSSRPTEGSFPAVRHVVPTFRQGDKGTASVSFNASYLAELAACLIVDGSPAVRITFRVDSSGNARDGAILVEGSGPGIAALMPCKV